MLDAIIAGLIGLAVGGAVCFPLGIRYRKIVSEKEISSAEEEGKRIINEAIKSAETKKKEALLEAKEEILKSRSEYEKEEKTRRAGRRKNPWPRSTRPSTRKTKRSRSSSAARPRCWSGSPALPPRRPSSI